jgi:hypothetical protein
MSEHPSHASKRPRTLAERLAHTFAVAAEGLPNVLDESDDYFRAFSVAFPAGSLLSPEAFHAAAGVGAHYRIDMSSADRFFDSAKEYGDPDIEARFELLRTLMSASLTDLSIAFARKEGAVRVRLWLFGRFQDNALVGLISETTET